MDRRSPESSSGRLGLNPERHREKQIDAQNLPNVGDSVKQVAGRSSAMRARVVLFTCPHCGDELRREPPAENGSTHLWCSCGSHTFPQGNLLPETPDEWAFVVKRVSLGIRDARAECEARIKRLMVSDHVRRYRDKFAKEGAS
jgi:predicted RNA-binding Zn-ribbon protein involved in translation (DUF1610 family)